MRTLADLKRDLVVGRAVKMTSFYGETDPAKHSFIGVVRYVVKKNSVGFYLNADRQAAKGSYFDYPKSSLLEYDGKTIKIYQSGIRPLTEEEKQIMKNEPRDDKQQEIDMMTDGSTMFYRGKRYF